MKKKIVFIVVCVISLIGVNNVYAATKVCTQEEIDSARATLSSYDRITVPIPSLGRTGAGEHNKANIYKMTLTNNSNGTRYNSFCLDSGKRAPSGTVYKIHHKIDHPVWYKAYQYAMEYKNDDLRYSVAQAALWLLRGEKADGKGGLGQLKVVARDIYINLNCETLLQMHGGIGKTEASSICTDARENSDNSTSKIWSILFNAFISKHHGYGISDFESYLYSSIDKAVDEFNSYDKYYNNTLYYWIDIHATNISDGTYQGMLAPFNCSDSPEPDSYTCVDSSGIVHDYTDEYNACVLGGGTSDVCKSKFETLYCHTITYGVVDYEGSSAVCTDDPTNIGAYYEYVDTSISGNAIPGKGEPEKTIGSYCNLFCLESYAQQIFPGNVRPAVSSGTYIIWPTSDATLSSVYKNQYPLKFTGQKTCYVVMSGEGNPVNTTNINTVYNNLVNETTRTNLYDASFARRNYESSRVSGGCEFIYRNESGGACFSSYNNMIQAQNDLTTFAESDPYQSALREKQEVDSYNSNLCEHDYCSEVTYYCTDSPTNIASISCPIITKQCNQQTASGCTAGSRRNISKTSQNALNEYNRLQENYNSAKGVYDNCQSEKNACNTYTANVNKVVQFANEIKLCATYTPSCSGSNCDIYDFATNIDLSWGDAEYGRTIYDSELEKYTSYTFETEGDSTVTNVDSSQRFSDIRNATNRVITEVRSIVENRKIKANVNVTYSLPTSGNLLYNYVVKRDDKYVSQTELPSSDSNYTTVGFSNLPISFSARTATPYRLTLSNIRFGDNGGQYSPSPYECNYEVTKTVTTSCVCPVGTKHEGKDLSSFIIDKGLTCYEAQQTMCDIDIRTCPDDASIDLTACMDDYDYFTCYDKYCRGSDEDKFCPDKPEINLSACLNNYSYSYCYNLLCTGPTGGYKCKNTLGVDGEMDITSCVYTKMAQGLSEDVAIDECDSLICPLSGLRIIYRTISLENPFPGKNVSNKVLGFNDDVKGRYPGTNWNDLTLVRNHILTSRGYDGSAIYQGEPLYTFVLTTQTINAIRNYNEDRELDGGYADYTLDCKLSNSRACVSDFVHNPELSGLVSGACSTSTSRSNFYACSGDS